MKVLDRYMDFLLHYQKKSLLDLLKRAYDFYKFKYPSIDEFYNEYPSAYDLLMDFQFIYDKLDLIYGISDHKHIRNVVYLETKTSYIENESDLLKSYTTFYTLYIQGLDFPNEEYDKAKYEWNDQDREIEVTFNDSIRKPFYEEDVNDYISLHLNLIIKIRHVMRFLVEELWLKSESEVNSLSVKILNLEISELNFVKNKSGDSEYHVDFINVNKQCNYLNLEGKKILEIIPITCNLSSYIVTATLYITYIDYRKSLTKVDYNPYILNYINTNREPILNMIRSIINQLNFTTTNILKKQ